jgi:hypothetical protein
MLNAAAMHWSGVMTKILGLGVLMLAAIPAPAQEVAIADDTPVAEATGDKAESAVLSSEAAPKDEEFTPPPGFKVKKRGELVLYCMRDSTVGTRFKTEKCYDEAQIRDYLAAQQENKRDIERVRSTCSSAAVCAPQ